MKLKVLLVIFSIVGTLAAVELICAILIRTGFTINSSKSVPGRIPFDRDRLEITNQLVNDGNKVIWWPKANQTAREYAKDKKTGEVIFDATYHIDEHFRRVTVQSDIKRRTKHLLFFGCSFVFGTGVNDDENLPASVAKYAKNFHAYNFGVSGYGANGVLARMRANETFSGVAEKAGAGIYVFIPPHLPRTLGQMSIVGNWGSHSPTLSETSDGRLEVDGTFADNYPIRTFIYKVLWRSHFRQLFNIDFPPLSPSGIEFFARVVNEIKNDYKKQFPNNEFYVVIYPKRNPVFEYADLFRENLKKLGINYLDYMDLDLETLTNQNYAFPYDGHPTPQAYSILGERIAKDLNLQ